MPQTPDRQARTVALASVLAAFVIAAVIRNHRPAPVAAGRAEEARIAAQPDAITTSKNGAPTRREALDNLFRALVDGRPLRVGATGAGRDFGRFLFRPTEAVADGFKVSLGGHGRAHREGSRAVSAYRGRMLGARLWDGAGVSSLVRVGDQLAGHLRLPDGEMLHLRTNPDTGAGEGFIEDAQIGASCAIDVAAGTASFGREEADAADDGLDPWAGAFAVEIEPDPPIMASSGRNPNNDNLQFTERPIPYGDAYQNSLKDALVLIVVDKGATGSDSQNNLDSKTAQFVSTMSNIAALYEDQLGLRVVVQELILTPNTAAYDDVAGGSRSLGDFRSWVSSNRSRSTYSWTMATKFGAVDGALGVAYLNSAAGSSGVSINEVGSITIPAHEMGHNMGSGHTSGGVMNPTSNSSRNFFTDLESNSDRTAAFAIYNYMSNGGASSQGRLRPSSRRLRNAEEIPFGDDDVVTTLPNTAVRFRPLANDETSVRHGETNTLHLVETGPAFPTGSGETRLDGDEIVFAPAPGFRGTVWFSYTLGGDVGNGGGGWLHKGDVAVNVGQTNGPPGSGGETGNPDFYHAGSGALTFYPLLNDSGTGFLNLSHVEPTLGTSGSADTDPNGMYIVSATLLDAGKGTLSTQTMPIYLAGGQRVNRIRALTFSPAAGASGPARVQYTVADSSGAQTQVVATILLGIENELVSPGARTNYKVPLDGSEDTAWFASDFDDSSWSNGSTGVGYERSTNGTLYTGVIGSDVEAGMYNGSSSVYLRLPFTVSALGEIGSLSLRMQYDDGFVAYLNGVEVIRRRAPEGDLAWDAVATEAHEADIDSFSQYNITASLGLLHEGENVLAVHGLNRDTDSSDMLIRPALVATQRFGLSRVTAPALSAFAIPAGCGLQLEAEVGLSSEAPFAGAPVIFWSLLEKPPGGAALFSDRAAPNTEVRFTEAGRYLLRLRSEEAGFIDDRLLTAYVGAPAAPSAIAQLPGVDAGVDQITDARTATLSALTFPAVGAVVQWTQVDGSPATISDPGAASTGVSFPGDGSYVFRATVEGQGGVEVFDKVTVVSGRGRVQLLSGGGLGRWLVPGAQADLSDGAGQPWRSPDFDDSGWDRGSAGFGYERDMGYSDLLGTDVQAAMYDTNTSLLIRRAFHLPVGPAQTSEFRLGMRADDGFVTWLNGAELDRQNAPAGIPNWDAEAAASNPDEQAIVVLESTVSVPAGTLRGGDNLLAVQALNSGITSSDLLAAAELSAELAAGGDIELQLVAPDRPARVLVPTSAALPPAWTTVGFDDAAWPYSAAAIGYETGSGGYQHHFHSDTEPAMFETATGALLRVPFTVPAGFRITGLSLRAKYEDAFVSYLDGVEVVRRGFVGTPAGDSVADGNRADSDAVRFEEIALDDHASGLAAGFHVLAVHALNAATDSSDFLFVPELVASADAGEPFGLWMAAYADPAAPAAARSADLDGDGLSNELEFWLGGDPSAGGTDVAGGARNVLPAISATPGGGFELRFWRRQGVVHLVQGTIDLSDPGWVDVTPLSEVISSAAPGYDLVVIGLPTGGNATFYRVVLME